MKFPLVLGLVTLAAVAAVWVTIAALLTAAFK